MSSNSTSETHNSDNSNIGSNNFKSKLKNDFKSVLVPSIDKERVSPVDNIGSESETKKEYKSDEILQKVIQSSIEIDGNILKEIIKPLKKEQSSRSCKRPETGRRKHERKHNRHSTFSSQKCRFILIATPPQSCHCCCHRRKKKRLT